jgi:hypothetical protein
MKVLKDSRKNTGVLHAILFWVGIFLALGILYICLVCSALWEQIKKTFI